MSSNKLVEYIDSLNSEYVGASIFTNWKRLNDNIADAVNQQYRPGEQVAREWTDYDLMAKLGEI